MNPLLWMTLVSLLSARSSLADLDQNWLSSIVRVIREKYGTGGQFSLAANIPMKIDPNHLPKVLQNNDRTEGNVENTLNHGEVYRGNNVVIAKHKQEYVGSQYVGWLHAEYRVLTNLNRLIPNAEGNLLLIYSFLSPCDEKCTDLRDPFNIINIIKHNVIPNWHDNVAFVFTKVFDTPKSGPGPNPTALRESLERLGNSGIGLQNIFRCDKIGGNSQCFSCSSQGTVSEVCVNNNFVPGQEASSSRIRDRSSRDRISRDRINRDRINRDRSSSRDRSSRNRSSRDRSRSPISRKGSGKSRMSRLDEFWFLM